MIALQEGPTRFGWGLFSFRVRYSLRMANKFYVHTTGPMDVFDGLHSLSSWVAYAEEKHQDISEEFNNLAAVRRSRTSWALQALFALQDAGTYWEGDCPGGPLVGVLPSPEGFETSPYLVVKQSNNGTTFLVSEFPLTFLESAETVEVKARIL